MKRKFLSILVIGILLLGGCGAPATAPASISEPALSPTATPTPEPNPSLLPATPTETEWYKVSFYVYVQSASSGLAGVHRMKPVGQVTVKNTDDIARTFKVEITHYYGGKGYTKEFTIQLEPGQIKTVIMDSDDVPSSAEVGKNYWAGDWGIDYQVIPDNKGKP